MKLEGSSRREWQAWVAHSSVQVDEGCPAHWPRKRQEIKRPGYRKDDLCKHWNNQELTGEVMQSQEPEQNSSRNKGKDPQISFNSKRDYVCCIFWWCEMKSWRGYAGEKSESSNDNQGDTYHTPKSSSNLGVGENSPPLWRPPGKGTSSEVSRISHNRTLTSFHRN